MKGKGPREFTCVDDDVLGQVSEINKGLVAHVTLVWADVVVVADVIGQLTRLHEPVERKRCVLSAFDSL